MVNLVLQKGQIVATDADMLDRLTARAITLVIRKMRRWEKAPLSSLVVAVDVYEDHPFAITLQRRLQSVVHIDREIKFVFTPRPPSNVFDESEGTWPPRPAGVNSGAAQKKGFTSRSGSSFVAEVPDAPTFKSEIRWVRNHLTLPPCTALHRPARALCAPLFVARTLTTDASATRHHDHPLPRSHNDAHTHSHTVLIHDTHPPTHPRGRSQYGQLQTAEGVDPDDMLPWGDDTEMVTFESTSNALHSSGQQPSADFEVEVSLQDEGTFHGGEPQPGVRRASGGAENEPLTTVQF